MNKRVLGRGLEALIPKGVTSPAAADAAVQLIPVEHITPNPHQPRKVFDDDKLKSLSESIEVDGILQPVVVRKHGKNFELIMGERRLQAARLAGVASIPAVVKKVEDVDSLRLALVENLQRENLNPIEVAEAYRGLVDMFGLSQSELARLVGKDRSSVANSMRLLSLPEEIRNMLGGGVLREGHARALLGLSTRSEQIAMANRIKEQNLNVRQVESETSERRPKAGPNSKKEKPANVRFLENAMSQYLATRVTIDEKRGGKGKMTIEFYSHDDFERLADLMNIPLPR